MTNEQLLALLISLKHSLDAAIQECESLLPETLATNVTEPLFTPNTRKEMIEACTYTVGREFKQTAALRGLSGSVGKMIGELTPDNEGSV